MAKQAILDVLEKTIGKYVKNLDPQSLNVAVWKGQIELNSLELDLDAINTELARQAAESPNLAIPFRVIDGSFGSLQVDVPWSHIMSQPVVLRAKGLKVVVEPYDAATSADYLVDAQISEQKRIQKIHEQRTQSIQSADDYRKQANALRKLANEELPANVGGDEQQKATFTENLVRRIIENIQLDVTDVHVSVKSTGSSAGVVLQSFSVFTTNKDGKREFVDRTKGDFLYKVLQITGLGVYLDELAGISKPKLNTDESDDVQHSYILAPLSFEAKLRQADSKKCIDYPKYLVQSELHQMSMLLSKTQLELGNKIALAIAPSENASHPLFPEYRPLTRVTKDSAKDWWRYAFRCVERLSGRGLWEDFFYAFKLRKEYIPLYKRSAHSETCPWISPLSDKEKAQLDSIEQDRLISVEGIMAWRNIADAQVEREQKKHDEAEKKKTEGKGGIMSALFGSKESAHSDESARDDDPPITLSIEEMQELEAVSLQQAEDAELSKDSKLYDIVFVMGSFKIGLDGRGAKQLASFEMGTTTTSFKANADGSYVFDSKLASMELQDKVTLKSLFPTVMRNIMPADQVAEGKEDGVFRFSLDKSRTGDQSMTLYMAAFEIVASQMLLIEIKQFFSLSGASPAQKGKYQNAMLAQSLSGTVDLFYDAHEGAEATPKVDFSEETAAAKEKISDNITSALVDAWKSKTKEKKKWTVDCDIHAPILVVPESCSSPDANVLIFDFGRFKFDYGKDRVAPKVKEWFDQQPGSGSEDSVIDPGSVGIKEMTFTIGRAGDFQWRQQTSLSLITDKMAQLTVIEPLSGSLAFGVLSDVKKDVPIVCANGIIPVVGLAISPSQISKVLSVYAGWKPVVSEFTGQAAGGKKPDHAEEDTAGGFKIVEEGADDRSLHEEDLAPSPIRRLSQARRASSVYHSARTGSSARKSKALVADAMTTMHISVGLTRLSIRVSSDTGEGVEAHLVSVSASSSQNSDGSSVNHLCMGWFWVLDRFKYDFPRRQRLIAHSTLPRSADQYSKDDKYDVLHSLPLNVFDAHYSGSSELADITLTSKGPASSSMSDMMNPFSVENPLGSSSTADSTLNARFSSLFVHWNPQAIKVITQAFSNTAAVLQDFAGKEKLPPPPSSTSQSLNFLTESMQNLPEFIPEEKRTTMFVSAQLKTLEITLDSAKDDEPLFDLTMSDTTMKMLSSTYEDESSKLLSLGLGDVRIVTPEKSRTDPSYRTMLGLAPQHTESLLSVTFSMGEEAVEATAMEVADRSKCDMCGEITLSPMRLVYIQAQMMTLVEYITQGVLGALTAQAASSAAGAAVEIAQAAKGDQYFVVKATGFDVIVPQSAASTNWIKVQAGDLVVDYRGGPRGGEANLSLSDVSMVDNQDERMLSAPMRMTVDVVMPPPDVGTIDDRAMRITINFFQAEFLLTRPQYQGIMLMLGQNIGEVDPMLRALPGDDSTMKVTPALEDDTRDTKKAAETSDITHGGAAAVDVQNRMYIDFNLDVLSLDLCEESPSDPIVHVAAVDAHIEMQLLSDKDTMVVVAKLQDLTCDDRRLKAMDRPFRSLMSQAAKDDSEKDGNANDLFYASYTQIGNSSMDVDLKLGSPRIVFIPDVVSQVLQFFQSPEMPGKQAAPPPPEVKKEENEEQQNDGPQVVQVQVDEKEQSVEAAFVSLTQGSDSQSVKRMSFSVKTANCSVVLIDMGASETTTGAQSKSLSQMTETIVFQGQFDAQTSLSSEIQSGRLVSARGELHGECMEMYTAHGSTFATPIQIVEPASISAFISLDPSGDRAKNLDIRFVTLSPLEVTFSTQNAALLNTILSTCSESLNTDETDVTSTDVIPLSEQEASNIEALSSALQNPNDMTRDDSSVHTQRSVADQSSVSSRNGAEDVMSLVTRMQVTMTETKLTLINDLQGMDEALFRINASNFVAGAEVTQGIVESSGSKRDTTFNVQVNTSFMADYFDSSVQLWKVLLKKPWEITLKSSREAGHHSSSGRMSSIVDVEAYPCLLSFSEQFVVSLGAASKMWSIYSIATTKAIEGDTKRIESDERGDRRASKKALAANAARSLVSSLPYAVENHSGVDMYFLIPSSGERRTCQSGKMQYFRFEPPQGTGSGGQRRYGQDVTSQKAVTLFVQGKTIEIPDIDAEFSRPRQAHLLGEGQYLVSRASKDGKTKTLHLSSPVDVHNCTTVPFAMSVAIDGKEHDFGVCAGHQGDPSEYGSSNVMFDERDGSTSKASKLFGIPLDLLSQEDKTTTLRISPRIDGGNVSGEVILPSFHEVVMHTGSGEATSRLEVTCKSPRDLGEMKKDGVRLPDPFSLQVRLKANLVDRKYPFIELFLEPRLVLENRLPIRITLRTPMPHTFKAKESEGAQIEGDKKEYETYHELAQSECVEVYTPGPSIAICVKCSDPPVGGTATDWMEGGWVDVPLVREFGLTEPIRCVFPFVRRSNSVQSVPRGAAGSEFFIAESGDALNKLLRRDYAGTNNGDTSAYEDDDKPVELVEPKASTRKVFITVCNYAVDHTGDVLFEMGGDQTGNRNSASAQRSFRRSSMVSVSCPFSAFASLNRRITLLPHQKEPLRLLHLTMEGDEGVRRSQPFYIDDISVCDGGLDSTPVNWEDNSESGFYAYRKLVDAYQFEVHVIPEFVVFNGSKQYRVLVKQQDGPGKLIEPGRVAPIRCIPKLGLVLSIDFIDLQATTAAMRVDVLGLRVAVVRARDSSPLGSLAVQTVIGNQDSKFAVKLGELKFGSGAEQGDMAAPSQGMFDNDTFRFRIRWSEFQLTLNEARSMDSDDAANTPSDQSGLDAYIESQSPTRAKTSPRQRTWQEATTQQSQEQLEIERQTQSPVCTIVLQRFTVDYQRIFKDGQSTTNMRSVRDVLLSPERSQFSVIVHNVRLLDETPNSKFPVVFDSTSSTSFFDLCLRFRGPLQAELVKVDLVDLNLAHAHGKSEKIIVQTSEDFVWKAIDVANRIAVSTAQLAGVDLKMEWDDTEEEYIVSIKDTSAQSPGDFDAEGSYTPPTSETLYDVNKARVSPFEMQVSFVRRPQASRYKHLQNVRGAKLVNYFTQRLKFKVDRADLKFSRYETSNVKGPPDQLIQILVAVYSQKMKYKVVSMLSAVSFEDWKNLAARDSGNDDFLAGDLLRVTGNLAGGTAGYFAKRVGGGIGTGINTVTSALGNEIEEATDKVGARAVGAGVNSVVTGLGEGVGDTFKGVGSGTGKVLQGAGKGVGQIFGGVTGGATMMAKGIGKGILEGDGKAVVSGFSRGAQSVGNGLGTGVESAVMGAADGVVTCGEGLATGVKSIGKGFASAFSGDCCICFGDSAAPDDD